jgi:hypothetical protein
LIEPTVIGHEGFLTLAASARLIKLKRLEMSFLDPEECKDLALFIAATMFLEKLVVDGEIDDFYPILCSLRVNGSLLVVSLPDDIETHFADAFCLRNKLLGRWMQSLAWTESSECQTKVINMHGTVQERHALSILPSLLQSAKQITASGASKVFCALMNLGESIGLI